MNFRSNSGTCSKCFSCHCLRIIYENVVSPLPRVCCSICNVSDCRILLSKNDTRMRDRFRGFCIKSNITHFLVSTFYEIRDGDYSKFIVRVLPLSKDFLKEIFCFPLILFPKSDVFPAADGAAAGRAERTCRKRLDWACSAPPVGHAVPPGPAPQAPYLPAGRLDPLHRRLPPTPRIRTCVGPSRS